MGTAVSVIVSHSPLRGCLVSSRSGLLAISPRFAFLSSHKPLLRPRSHASLARMRTRSHKEERSRLWRRQAWWINSVWGEQNRKPLQGKPCTENKRTKKHLWTNWIVSENNRCVDYLHGWSLFILLFFITWSKRSPSGQIRIITNSVQSFQRKIR